MDFIERQGDGESANRNDEHHGDEKRQSYVDEKSDARPAGKINKLLESQRPENLALYFYKLGDLKTHKFILLVLYRGQDLYIFLIFPARVKEPFSRSLLCNAFLPLALSAPLPSFFPQTD